MEPFSILSAACNVIDLLGKAAKCVVTFKELCDSADGITKNHEILSEAAQTMGAVAADLNRVPTGFLFMKHGDQLRAAASQCAEVSQKLRDDLERCRVVGGGKLSAIKATFRHILKKNDIQKLQDQLESCRRDINTMVSADALHGIEEILLRMNAAGLQRSDTTKKLEVLDDCIRANAGLSHEMLDQIKELQFMSRDVLEAINQERVIRALYQPVLEERFEEVREAAFETFGWIFADRPSASSDEREGKPQDKPRSGIDPSSPPSLGATNFTPEQESFTTEFTNWLRCGSGIFHITGKPGSGKSTLVKYLCRHPRTRDLLKEWADENGLAFANFFFWRVGTREQKSLRGLVRGLLYEVLRQAPSLTSVLFPQHWSPAGRIKMHLQDSIRISAEETRHAFNRLCSEPLAFRRFRFCFFIDGLDEFDDQGTNESYRQLLELLQNWTANSSGRVKMLVSSRELLPFLEFPARHRFSLPPLTTGDIQAFVRGTLERHPHYTYLLEADKTRCLGLLERISTRADGVFLWVALLLKSLERGLESKDSIDILEKRVKECPKELDAFFEAILERIEPCHRQGAHLLLAVVTRMNGMLLSDDERPMEYKAYDEWAYLGQPLGHSHIRSIGLEQCYLLFEAADAEKLGDVDFARPGWTNPSSRDASEGHRIEEETKAKVRSRCGGLLEIMDQDTIKLIHRSVPEALQKYFARKTSQSRLNDIQVARTLAWLFLVQHRCFELSLGTHRWRIFCDRLCHFVARLRQTSLEGEIELFRLLLLLEEALYVEDREAVVIDSFDVFPLHTSILSWASYAGLYELIEWVQTKSTWLDDDRRRFNVFSSLLARVRKGKIDNFTVVSLDKQLQRGFPTDVVYPDVGFSYEGQSAWLAFLVPSLHGHAELPEPLNWKLMELWLRHGASPDVEFWYDGFMFCAQSKYGGGTVRSRVHKHAMLQGLRQTTKFLEAKGGKVSLRDFIIHYQPPTCRTLLELLDKDDKRSQQTVQPLDEAKKQPSKEGSEQLGKNNEHSGRIWEQQKMVWLSLVVLPAFLAWLLVGTFTATGSD